MVTEIFKIDNDAVRFWLPLSIQMRRTVYADYDSRGETSNRDRYASNVAALLGITMAAAHALLSGKADYTLLNNRTAVELTRYTDAP